jgi:hypothetical protein
MQSRIRRSLALVAFSAVSLLSASRADAQVGIFPPRDSPCWQAYSDCCTAVERARDMAFITKAEARRLQAVCDTGMELCALFHILEDSLSAEVAAQLLADVYGQYSPGPGTFGGNPLGGGVQPKDTPVDPFFGNEPTDHGWVRPATHLRKALR